MKEIGFFDDPKENLFFMAVAVFVFTSAFLFTGLDSQIEFLVSSPGDYTGVSQLSVVDSQNDSLEEIVFTEEQVDLLNEVSSRSLGFDAVADERLYCFALDDRSVEDLRLADSIEESSLTSVAGGCLEDVNPVDGFIHTQPGFNEMFSEEDKALESSDISVSCIQYSEISVSPISGEITGLNCAPVQEGHLKTDLSVDVTIN